MRLNPAKCSFGVQARKFLGFTMTKRGNEANPDKFQTFITMRSPINIKEVQQLTVHLAAADNTTILFFAALNKKERFE